MLRIIPRLDVKAPNLIKGVRLEGLRVIGDPQEYAVKYYKAGADELLYMDIVASLYDRNNLANIVEKASRDVFIPMTVGGGVRSVEDAKTLLRAGADKVAINTAALKRPELVREMAETFGAQCMVLSVEAKRKPSGGWEAYYDNGREHSGRDVIDWVRQGAEFGAGELLITSVDQEGTRKGYDIELVAAVTQAVDLPVIASGGMGSVSDLTKLVEQAVPDAVSMADILHYERIGLVEMKAELKQAGLRVREIEP
ncbi:imidazole glycerol phosphate synthase subunit HisF [Aestuariispira insulae]|uniref:Imidazole glycerol phosphate synthase subunit HisF n=1 Tax=Aestuariispira insulae TaxID=1461337 RepID=A0A3D9HXF4_9PROT|nr:imidazole glycerol phosphate synthase cyclase subunit [Aestuariispira insulae]RED54099.1 cyclase [Aestuariispira insulae]